MPAEASESLHLQPPQPLESLTVSPVKLAFNDQAVGTTSIPQTVTVINRGTARRIFSDMNITGNFSQTNDCGTELMIGDSCNVEVTFTPATPGLTHGSLEMSYHDPLFSSIGLFSKVDFSGHGIKVAKTHVPQKDKPSVAPTTQTQTCAPEAGCVQTNGQTGGLNIGRLDVHPLNPNDPYPTNTNQEVAGWALAEADKVQKLSQTCLDDLIALSEHRPPSANIHSTYEATRAFFRTDIQPEIPVIARLRASILARMPSLKDPHMETAYDVDMKNQDGCWNLPARNPSIPLPNIPDYLRNMAHGLLAFHPPN
jgi:hypothetical protein